MPIGEKQSPVSAKKVVLRDLPSETNNFASDLLDHSPLKDRGSIHGIATLSGTKRKQPSSPSTPNSQPHSIYSGHLVYVRRKLDIEASKVCVENAECVDPPSPRNCWKVQPSEKKLPESPEAKLSGVSTMLLSPTSFISPLKSENQSQGEGYWKERFIRLQLFLKSCDQSNKGKYIQSLRSLSATGRSMHAIELEKRAIQLLLDEERELQKMKALNVLGKSSPDSHASLSYQAFSPEPLAPEK